MADVAVVGAGFWGSAVARLARERGATVELIDDGNRLGASRNASGYLREDWLHSETVTKHFPDWALGKRLEEGLTWAVRQGAKAVTEQFHNVPRGTTRNRDGLYMMSDPYSVMDEPTVHGKVERLERHGKLGCWLVHVEGREPITASYVVLAAGAWTPGLLKASGLPPLSVAPLIGRALLCSDVEGAPDGVATYMLRPYRDVSVRTWTDGSLRIGETLERYELRPKALGDLVAVMQAFYPSARIKQVLEGWRPECVEPTVRQIAPGCVAAVGGGRVGLLLAWPAANEAFRQLAG